MSMGLSLSPLQSYMWWQHCIAYTVVNHHASKHFPCRHDLQFRRVCLQAESIQHLCKSIVMENTKLAEPFPGVAKYYCVIVQVGLYSCYAGLSNAA